MGTLAYIAPERISGTPVTGAADIYSLGAVLYECLTGSVPYPRPSEAGVLFAHLDDPVPMVRHMRTDLPRALDEVIVRAMAKDPAARHGEALELMEDTRRALAVAPRATPVAARRPPTTARASVPRLIGRERELAACLDLLAREDLRLLTLVGMGGTGKSSLAIALATRLAQRLADGVVLVWLAELREPGLVARAIAKALGRRPPQRS